MRRLLTCIILVSGVGVVFHSCLQRKPKDDKTIVVSPPLQIDKKDTALLPKTEYMTLAILYHQQSGEVRAMCYQAFQLAKLMLTDDLENKKIYRKRAVVLDIDETVLDNSPYEAQCVLDGALYPVKWVEWCQTAFAQPIPGALDFLDYTAGLGVDIFYVTNRKAGLLEPTIENLKKAGFPEVDKNHILMRTGESSKENRRSQVLRNYHISLLIGDNLSDFSSLFDNQTNERRNFLTDSLAKEFGRRFIILPNAMYGDWEGAIYGYDYSISEQEKRIARKESLKGF